MASTAFPMNTIPPRPRGGYPPPVLPMFINYGGEEPIGNCRFRIIVNGEIKTTSGIVGSGVFTIGLHWVARRRQRKDGKKQSFVEGTKLPPIVFEEIVLEAGGLDISGDNDIYFTAHKQNLEVGDVIDIEILPPGEIDHAAGHVEIPRQGREAR